MPDIESFKREASCRREVAHARPAPEPGGKVEAFAAWDEPEAFAADLLGMLVDLEGARRARA